MINPQSQYNFTFQSKTVNQPNSVFMDLAQFCELKSRLHWPINGTFPGKSSSFVISKSVLWSGAVMSQHPAKLNSSLNYVFTDLSSPKKSEKVMLCCFVLFVCVVLFFAFGWDFWHLNMHKKLKCPLRLYLLVSFWHKNSFKVFSSLNVNCL